MQSCVCRRGFQVSPVQCDFRAVGPYHCLRRLEGRVELLAHYILRGQVPPNFRPARELTQALAVRDPSTSRPSLAPRSTVSLFPI